jgi:PAS domain S-box-containing protein
MGEAGDKAKTKAQLIEELQALRQQLNDLRGREESERGQVEESSLSESDMLRVLMENVPDWIFFKDAESRIIRSNKPHAQLLGFDDPQEVVGKTDFDFFPPEEAQGFFEEEQAMLQAAQPVVARLGRTSDRDGEVYWVSETKIPLKDETGQVIGLVGLSRNVTELVRAEEALRKAHAEVEKQVEERTAELTREIAERKQAEEALKRQTMELLAAAEVSDAASTILEPDALIQRVVDLIQERFDLYYAGLFLLDEPAEWAVLRAGTGKAGQEMLAYGHKLEVGGASMIGVCVANREACIALDVGKEAVRFENPWLPETRSELALPLVSRGEAIGALTIQSVEEAAFSKEDISVLQTMADQVANAITNARLFADARHQRGLLQALLDNSPDYVFFKDRESRFIRTNKAHAQNLLGISDPREVEGKTDFDLFPGEEEDTQRFYDEEQTLMETGVPVVGREWTVPSQATGEEVWLSEHKIPMLDESGKAIGLIGIGRDITALKVAELALERRALQLETAAEVSRAAGSLLDLDVVIQQVVDVVRERFDLYYVGLFLVDEMGRWAVLRAGTGEAGQKMIEQRHRLEVGGVSMIGDCVTSKQPRVALDTGEEPARFDNPFLPQTRSELALPLISRDEAIGALTIQSTEEAAFGDEDIAILQIMADQLANVITNARLFQQTQAALTEMERVQRQYMEQAWGEYTRTQAVLGFQQTAEGVVPLGGEALPEVERVLEELDTVVVDGEDGTSVLTVPVLLRGQPLGVLGFRLDRGAESIGPDDIALAESVSEQFALAAENLRLLDDTQRRAARERLTRDITDKMRRAASIEGVVQAAVDELFDALGTSRAFVRLGISSDGDSER